MGSTGSVSSWEEALLLAAIQYPVPVVNGPEDIQVNVDRICKAVASTNAGYPGLDLIEFPEYSTQGLNTAIWSYDEMLLSLDSPEVGQFKQACKVADVWACSQSWKKILKAATLLTQRLSLTTRVKLHFTTESYNHGFL